VPPGASPVEATLAASGSVTVGAICSEGLGTGESESDLAKYVIGFRLDMENDLSPVLLHPERSRALSTRVRDCAPSFRMIFVSLRSERHGRMHREKRPPCQV